MSYDEIIASVLKNPHLYVPTHRNYRSRCQRMKTWRRIADELGCKDKDAVLRKRWKHLKDKYRKELKKVIAKNKGQIPKHCTSPWPVFEKLHFLRDDVLYRDRLMKQKKYMNSLEQGLSDSDMSDTNGSVGAADTVMEGDDAPGNADSGDLKVKTEQDSRDPATLLSDVLQNQMWPPQDMTMMDPDLLFLVSLLPSMKGLTELQKLQFRGKVNDLLLEALTVNECNPQLYMQQQLQETNESEQN